MNDNETVLMQKSYAYALRIVKVYQHLVAEFKAYVLSKQLLRAGTSIGANLAEADRNFPLSTLHFSL